MNNDTSNTSTALATVVESGFSPRQMEIIRKQIAPDADEDQLALFLEVCRGTGLNPFMRQIHAVFRNAKEKRNGKEIWLKRMTIQTGIDGYRLLAARTGQLAGIDDAVFDTEDAEHPNKASVTVWRFVAGHRVAFTATARWSEYVQLKDEYNKDNEKTGKKIPTEMWTKMPYLMLAKCAEALALRKAFPAELSGMYTHEEMMQADVVEADSTFQDDSSDDPNQRADVASQTELVQWLREGQFGTVPNVERFLTETLKRRMTISALSKGASNITVGEVAKVTEALARRREELRPSQQSQQAVAAAAESQEPANNFEDLPVLNQGVRP